MSLRGSDLIVVLMIVSMETEFFIAILFFSVMFQYMFWMMGLTGLVFLLYYLQNAVKSLRLIGGHFCLSSTLFYSENRWDIDDIMISSVREYETPSQVIDQFEQSDEFLKRFNDNVLKSSVTFPECVDSIKSKFYYLELKKRLKPSELDELIESKGKNSIIDIMRARIHELTKEMNKNPILEIPMPAPLATESADEPPKPKSKKKGVEIPLPTDSKEDAMNTQTQILKDKDSKEDAMNTQTQITKDNTKTIKIPPSISGTAKIMTSPKPAEPPKYLKAEFRRGKKYIWVTLILLAAELVVIVRGIQDIASIGIYFLVFLILTIIFIITEVYLAREASLIRVQIPEPVLKMDAKLMDFVIKECFPIYPYCHFSHVRFYTPAFGFRETIIISPLSFFDSFKFAKGMIRYKDYFYESVTSPCVLEWVGDVEEQFPILNTKFCTGLVGKDEQLGLSFNLIENAKLQTYYRLMCESRADFVVKDNHVINLESALENIKRYLSKSKQRNLSDANLIANTSEKDRQAKVLLRPPQTPLKMLLQNPKFQMFAFMVLLILVIIFAAV